MFRYLLLISALSFAEENTYAIEPCLKAETEEECLSAEEALQPLQEQNADCIVEDLVFEGYIEGLCCYDLTAHSCGSGC